MAFDEQLAGRVWKLLEELPDASERRMFGGVAFMVGGHIACGVIGDEVMLRLGEEQADAALEDPHVRPFDFTGRPSRKSVFVEAAALRSDAELAGWVQQALAYTRGLPPKHRVEH
jgi:TfoX/Sxy family transcriptional regulator of competence genes